MAKQQNTFAKRQREQAKKQKANDKRERRKNRAEIKDLPPAPGESHTAPDIDDDHPQSLGNP